MVSLSALAKQLGLQVSRNHGSDLVVLSGERGTVVFNPRLRGILVGDKVMFRGHRVVVSNDRVSIPKGFVAACGDSLKLATTSKPSPARPAVKRYDRFHVVIDPGHGGRDPGAVGVRSGYEKTVNLLTSQLIAAKLRAKGARVTLTRDSDEFIPLNERAAIGNRARADLFVSIHSDANGSRATRGFSLYVCHTKPSYSDATRAAKIFRECRLEFGDCRERLTRSRSGSRRLASLIRVHMGKATSSPDRGTRLGALRVLERSMCPAVLVELGFMSNPSENLMLLRFAYQDRLAAGVAAGILRFLDD